MRDAGLQEHLARHRRRFERFVFGRMDGAISWEDAEDIVSDALVRVQTRMERHPPARGKEAAWFARIVLNQGVDFLRARDGRPTNGSAGRPVRVALPDVADGENAAGASAADPPIVDVLAEESERRQVGELVARAMSVLDREDVELIELRHIVAPRRSRDELAAMAGLTLGESGGDTRGPGRASSMPSRATRRPRGAGPSGSSLASWTPESRRRRPPRRSMPTRSTAQAAGCSPARATVPSSCCLRWHLRWASPSGGRAG